MTPIESVSHVLTDTTMFCLYFLCSSKYFLTTVFPMLGLSHNYRFFPLVWQENQELPQNCKAHGQENDQVQSMSRITQAKVAFCFLAECAFVTFLHGITLLQLLRNIAWDAEVVKKMKWYSAVEARCISRDIPSLKYQSSAWQRPLICVYGSKKRYWQNKNAGDFRVLHIQFMWDNGIILWSHFYFRY